MKLLLILCISYLAGVNSLPTSSESTKFEEDEKTIITQCAQELNTDVKKYIYPVETAHIENPDDETICMAACGFRRWINGTIPAVLLTSNKKSTVYYGLLTLIRSGNGEGYDHDEVVDKLVTCYDEESTECDFFKCVKVHEPPFNSIVGQSFEPQQLTV